MEPFGEFTRQVREAFNEKAGLGGSRGGCHPIRPNSLEELTLGSRRRKRRARRAYGSMAYDVTLDTAPPSATMMASAGRAAKSMQAEGAHMVALNCGTGWTGAPRARAWRGTRSCSLPVMAQPMPASPSW